MASASPDLYGDPSLTASTPFDWYRNRLLGDRGAIGRASDVRLIGSGFELRVLPRYHCAVALGKLGLLTKHRYTKR